MLFKIFETGQWYEITLRFWDNNIPSEDKFAEFEKGITESLGRVPSHPQAILIPRKNFFALRKYWRQQVLLYNSWHKSEVFGQKDDNAFGHYKLYIDPR